MYVVCLSNECMSYVYVCSAHVVCLSYECMSNVCMSYVYVCMYVCSIYIVYINKCICLLMYVYSMYVM